MKRYQTLLFDVDGTLLDFDEAQRCALQKTCQHYHIPCTNKLQQAYETLNQELWKAFEAGQLDRHTLLYTRFTKLFSQFDIEVDGVAFEDSYRQALDQEHALMPDALEVICALEKEFDLYVVSNGVTQTQFSRLKDSGLQPQFKKIFVSELVGHQKPKKEFFDYVFSHIEGMKLDKTLIIGDSLSSDIQGGITAGIDTCWFHPKDSQERVHGATYEIHALKELYAIVGKEDVNE